MKRKFLIFLAALLLILLCGCEAFPLESKVQVTIMDIEGCTISRNGIWVEPGEDAVFMLDLDPGFTLSRIDYDGSYSTAMNGTRLELVLENVKYPTQVRLQLTNRYCSITYMPNGAEQNAQTMAYDTTVHLRPNTSIGTDIFSRDGYTLESWNTQPDGSGERIGLGSRVSVDTAITLYAQWAKWEPAASFTYTADETVTITGYHGEASSLVIPAAIDGKAVTAIAAGAFADCAADTLILPTTIETVEADAFRNGLLKTVTLYDNIVSISDSSFSGCAQLQTLRINAIEEPYGYNYRKESLYADKVDLLIKAQGKQKIVFYGGCSMWYNLDGGAVATRLGDDFAIINMGLNGTANSGVQMQIIGAFIESGDILFHTPEISSPQQMMINEVMGSRDDKLWCGLEYNYDLFTLVDLRTVSGSFDSLRSYLDIKRTGTTYQDTYTGINGEDFCDAYGCLAFDRTTTSEQLADDVFLDPTFIDDDAMARLEGYYNWFRNKGVTIYVSHACLNIDAVPEEQRTNLSLMNNLFKEAIEKMDGPVVISNLSDYMFYNNDFYDTNYHLLSIPTTQNTWVWLRDLTAQLEKDGLWEDNK